MNNKQKIKYIVIVFLLFYCCDLPVGVIDLPTRDPQLGCTFSFVPQPPYKGLVDAKDSSVIQSILNLNGMNTLPFRSLINCRNGRVVTLHLKTHEYKCGYDTIFLDTNLNKIPTAIGFLSELETLDLTGNKLESIEPSVFTLVKLKCLILEENKLTLLSDSIGKLIRLTKLNLNYNKLISMPDSLQQLDSLEFLSINGQMFKIFPKQILYLTNLKRLLIHNTNIESLSSNIYLLKKLEYLDISDNWIHSLPDSIVNMSKLKEINVDFCDICSPSYSIKTWLDSVSTDSEWLKYQISDCAP
jgi:hypothetical protein